MAAPKIYGQMLPTADGILLQEAESVEWSTQNKEQDVETLVNGWSGITPGPITTHIKVEAFLPTSGPEVDFDKLEQTGAFTTLGVLLAGGSGKKALAKGRIRNVSKKSGVGQNSKVSFDFIGPPMQFV